MRLGWHDVIAVSLSPDERTVIDAVLAAAIFAAITAVVRMMTTARRHRAEMKETVDQLVVTVEAQGQTLIDLDNRIARMFPNGRNTEDPGDLIARIAEALGVIPPKEQS